MTDDPRLASLLDELLDSQRTPEEVCSACPELLPQVRRRWRQVRRVRAELEFLFPSATDVVSRPRLSRCEVLPTVAGYQVESVLGRGGMGVVYRARHLRLNRPVALKMLLAGSCASPEQLERFMNEAEAVAALRHPNVVQIYDVGDVDGRPYFTMEVVEGGSLATKIAEAPLPPHQVAAFMIAVAGAVEAAHQSGIIHRDLKPANILLSADGTPKVSDFGLARRLESDSELTLSGAPLGTPNYMAPEQARGAKSAIGPATDVCALGAILYELLTGRPPFQAEIFSATLLQVLMNEPVPPQQLNRRVPRDLETICLKCLEKNPARRYSSAAALAEDLQRFVRNEPIAARPCSVSERSRRWLSRNPWRAAALAATVIIVLIAIISGTYPLVERVRLLREIEADVREADRLQQGWAIADARSILDKSRTRLAEAGFDTNRKNFARVLDNQQLLEQLESIRMDRFSVAEAEGRKNYFADTRYNNIRADLKYEQAFKKAGFGEPANRPDPTAEKIRTSSLRVPLVASLDDWAACCSDATRQAWILEVARRADHDAWRNKARNSAAWQDVVALTELTNTTRKTLDQHPTSLLLALGERLHSVGGDGIPFLRRVHENRPEDFWTNFVLANALYGFALQSNGDPAQAAPYYQKALAIRPTAAAVHNNLGLVLYHRFWLNDGVEDWGGPGAFSVFRTALRINPDFAPAHNNLGLAFKAAGGRFLEADHEQEEALRIDPELSSAHFNLAVLRAATGEINDAIDLAERAIGSDSSFALAHYHLGIFVLSKGHYDDADLHYPKGRASTKSLRDEALQQVRLCVLQLWNLDSSWSIAPNRLDIPGPDLNRLDKAIGHFRSAMELEPTAPLPHGSLGQALLAKHQFAEAEAALQSALERLPASDQEVRAKVERLQERCRQLLALESSIPDIIQGVTKPAHDDCLELAQLCFVKKYYATAVLLYTAALANTSQLFDDLRVGHRYNAARAAALAGCGQGNDAAALDARRKNDLLHQAYGWLKRDITAWKDKLANPTAADQIAARRTLTRWRDDPALATLRDPAALDNLSLAEREEWKLLWTDLDALLVRFTIEKDRPD